MVTIYVDAQNWNSNDNNQTLKHALEANKNIERVIRYLEKNVNIPIYLKSLLWENLGASKILSL